MQGEPGEWLPFVPIPATTMGVQRMPSPPWLASWHLLSLALLTVLSTNLGFHISLPSMGTHRLKSQIVGSRGILSPSSSKVSGNPHRKEATISFSSGSSSKSEPPPLDPSSPGGVLGSADWLGTGSSTNLTWWHLFHPSPLSLW